MSLSRKSPERKAKLKARKERWEKGESGLQRAGRFLFNKESYKETKAKWKKDREDKKAGKTTTSKKPSTAKSRARAANVAIHGEKAISGLEAKNKDFQKMKKGGITKAQFIKKYPNSQTAKKAAKRKPRAQRGGRK